MSISQAPSSIARRALVALHLGRAGAEREADHRAHEHARTRKDLRAALHVRAVDAHARELGLDRFLAQLVELRQRRLGLEQRVVDVGGERGELRRLAAAVPEPARAGIEHLTRAIGAELDLDAGRTVRKHRLRALFEDLAPELDQQRFQFRRTDLTRELHACTPPGAPLR
jgi:hypothetical protein